MVLLPFVLLLALRHISVDCGGVWNWLNEEISPNQMAAQWGLWLLLIIFQWPFWCLSVDTSAPTRGS